MQQTKSEGDDLIDKERGKFTASSIAARQEAENIENFVMSNIEDSINNMVDNITNLTKCKDNNEAELELCCEEVIADISVIKSANKFEFQS